MEKNLKKGGWKLKRQNYGDSYAQDEPEKELLEDEEPEWEWDQDPIREKIKKKRGKAEDSQRASRWRGGGKKRF